MDEDTNAGGEAATQTEPLAQATADIDAEGDAPAQPAVRPTADIDVSGDAAERAEQPAAQMANIAEMVDRWFGDHFPGSAVAASSDAWNVAYAAKEILKQRIAAFLDGAR